MIYWAKFEGKLFSDPKRSGPLLEKVSLNFLLFGISDSYVQGIVFLRLGVSDSYVLWVSFGTFWCYRFLRFGVSFLMFEGL